MTRSSESRNGTHNVRLVDRPHIPTYWTHRSGPAVYGSKEEDCRSIASSGVTSERSPEDTVGDEDPVSPSEELRLYYYEQMVWMVQSLDRQVTAVDSRPKDKILGRLCLDTPGAVAFPVLEGVLEMARSVREKPSSIPATSCKVK